MYEQCVCVDTLFIKKKKKQKQISKVSLKMFLAIIATWVANEGADALPRCSTHIVGLIHDVEEGGDGLIVRWGRVTGQARALGAGGNPH